MATSVIQDGTVIAEGKTKRLCGIVDQPNKVLIISKDDITAGDGDKHDVILGKAVLSTMTTCNVFRLLKACGVPVAFAEQVSSGQFVAEKCAMIPWEVVIRREAHGSYLERNPHLAKGHLFPKLVFELFAKTSGKKWRGMDIPMDDPFVKFEGDTAAFYLPHWTKAQKAESKETGHKGYLVGQKPFLTMPKLEFFGPGVSETHLKAIEHLARYIFLILEKAWQLLGKRMVDFKLEFGFTADGRIVLADVVDNDSWRLVNEEGGYDDKQVYRDGGGMNEVTQKYREISELSCRFALPKQQIILWKGSDSDDTAPFFEAINKLLGDAARAVLINEIICSMHKESMKGNVQLQQAIQFVPDSVLVSFIGMSNGAGPTLSGSCAIPSVTVPASVKEFAEDIWSSLRTPSNVPVATVLNLKNAALAVLEILALRNPLIYAKLHLELEKRLLNVLVLQ